MKQFIDLNGLKAVVELLEEDIQLHEHGASHVIFTDGKSLQEKIDSNEIGSGIEGAPGPMGPQGPAGKDGEQGVSIKSVYIKNGHLMVELDNGQILDAGEMPVQENVGGASSEEVAYLQSEIDHMMKQIADDTYGVVYEWVYHFNVETGHSDINVAHIDELWADVDAMGIDAFVEAIYEQDAYRLYALRCVSDLKYMNRYEVIPVADNPMQQIGAIENWAPVKDITNWTFEGDIEDPTIYLNGAPTSDMVFALLKVKK